MDVQFLVGFREPFRPSSLAEWLGQFVGAGMVVHLAGPTALFRPVFLNHPDATIRVSVAADSHRLLGTSSGEPLLWSPEDAFAVFANVLRLCSVLEKTIIEGGAAFWMMGGELADLRAPEPWQFAESAAFGTDVSVGIDTVAEGFFGRPTALIHAAILSRIFETFSRSDTLEEHQSRIDLATDDATSTVRPLQALFDRHIRQWGKLNSEVSTRLAQIDREPHFP